MEENEVAGLQAALGRVLRNRYCTVRPLSIMAAPVSEVDRVGQLADALGRHHAQLAVGAGGWLA